MVNDDYQQAEPISDDEVQSICSNWLEIAHGGDSDVGSINDVAMEYYLGEARGDEILGRSSFISTDVADMVEASLSQITPMITGSSLAEFDPLNQEDEDQAAQESRFCNHVVASNGGYVVLQAALKSGLLKRVSAVEVMIDELPTVSEEDYENLTQIEMVQKLQPTMEGEQVVLARVDEVEGMEPLYSVTIKRVRTDRKIKIEPILPENLRWVANSDVVTPEDSLFIARKRLVARSELYLAGYDKDVVEKLPSYINTSEYTEDADQAASDLIEVYTCYAMIDSDGDGVAERRKVVLAGDEGRHLLDNQPADFVPIAMGSPFLMPGQLVGLGLFDKLKSIQDGKTQSMRQWLDNQNANNNRRIAVDIKGIQDPDSVFDSKPAGVIKAKRDPSTVIMPIPVDDIGPSCQNLLGYFDTITAHRAGSALDMQTQQQTLQGDTAHGIERQMAAKELMISMMARNLAESMVKQMFLLVHATLRTQFDKPINAKMAGQWQQSDPRQWLPRNAITINIGRTASDNQRRYSQLRALYDDQKELMAQGSTLVTEDRMHNVLTDMIACSLEVDSDRYFVDPQSPEGQQANQQKSQSMQQQQMEQKQQQAMMLDAQVKLSQAEVMKATAQQQKVQMQAIIDGLKHQLNELKATSEEGNNVAEMQFKYDKLNADVALKLTEIEQAEGKQLNADYESNMLNG